MDQTSPVSVSPWFTPAEAAVRAKRSYNWVMLALAKGELEGHQPVPRGKWSIHVDALDAWIRGEKADVKVPAVTRARRAS